MSNLVPRTPDMQRRRRWLVLFLAIGGALLLVASYQFPYWHFNLVAPQYPKGLSLEIGLSGITGDVSEIDILNHYIGMMKMSTAASLERAMSVYIVTIAALGTVAGVIATGKRMGWLGVAVALGLPLGFLVDTTYWMYRFGHELEPQAPLKFSPFMPMLVGKGTIGQFHTAAWPASGFWMAIGAALMVALAVYLRKQVCDHCPKTATCGKTCNHLIVFTSSLETSS